NNHARTTLMSPVSNKIALFIDGANLYATAKTLGFDIDYKRLLKEFQSRGTLLRAFYYTAIIEDQEYSSIRPLIDWLDYNVYTVLVELQSKLGRDPSERPAPREPRHHAPQFLQRATTMAPRGADDEEFDD